MATNSEMLNIVVEISNDGNVIYDLTVPTNGSITHVVQELNNVRNMVNTKLTEIVNTVGNNEHETRAGKFS